MAWSIEFYTGVMDDILAMPPKIQARTLKLLEMIEEHGANLGSPHTEPMGDGLFEIRAKAKEGIGRALFCYMEGENVQILHAFVKKKPKNSEERLNAGSSPDERGRQIMSNLQALKDRALQNEAVKAEYDALHDEFSLINQLLQMRNAAGLTQQQVAERMGTRKSNISRLEKGSNATVATLEKYASACGYHLHVGFERQTA